MSPLEVKDLAGKNLLTKNTYKNIKPAVAAAGVSLLIQDALIRHKSGGFKAAVWRKSGGFSVLPDFQKKSQIFSKGGE